MDDYNDYNVPTTRVWWEDREVAFVRWTDQALVFAWRESDETAMHIPRGAVLRLLDRGVLRIDGDAPAWLYDSHPLQLRRPEHPAPAPKKAAPKAAPQKDRGRFNIIARLIQKLGGGDGATPPQQASPARQEARLPKRANPPKAAAQARAGARGAQVAPTRSARGVD